MAGLTNFEATQRLLCGNITAYTPSGKSYFKREGRYGRSPKVGALIYFWKSDRGDVGHVGIVASVRYVNGMFTIETIEGNTNADPYNRDGGKVALKTYEFLPSQVGGGNRIDGFGYPLYEAETCSAEQLIDVARTQIGYTEKRSAKEPELYDFTANAGTSNYTKYGKFYGEAVGQLSTYINGQWCAMFCSWCAYTAVCKAHEFKPTGWIQQDDGSWMFCKADGEICRNEWLYHGGRWYVFDGSGKMVTGWFLSGSQDWYYMADDGGMIASQWLHDDGHDYYFTRSGVMARSAYVAANRPAGPSEDPLYYWVDAEGQWETEWDTDKPHLDIYEIAV